MAHDFAKQRPSASGGRKPLATAKPPSDSGNHWSWFFTGLLSGVFLAFIAYVAVVNPAFPGRGEATGEVVRPPSDPDDGARPRTEFDFYESLPEAEIQVDVVPVDIARRTLPDDDFQYLLQAGSFQDPADAESLRAGIILLNMNARVVSGAAYGRTWHRVQVGPFQGHRAMEDARDTLARNNIDTFLLKMK